jgi:hypothetical protein
VEIRAVFPEGAVRVTHLGEKTGLSNLAADERKTQINADKRTKLSDTARCRGRNSVGPDGA